MDQVDDKAAVALHAQSIEAWNRRHAADFAALFAQDGKTVGSDGSPLDGQAAIASALQKDYERAPT